ncbi:MAG: hypothetical protein V7604_2282 [Hyphomicrobiales bacterium]|jgi:hypothetical protein
MTENGMITAPERPAQRLRFKDGLVKEFKV